MSNQNIRTTFILLASSALALALLAGYFRESKEKIEVPLNNLAEKISIEEQDDVPSSDNKISFRSLIERSYQAPAISRGSVIQSASSYTKYTASYQSDTYTISGVLYIPTQKAPESGYPVLITNHGYIDPSVYTNGRGLKREQEYFASRGYVVFHPDYRNHAQSSKTENDPIQDRLGYITDIIHAVESLKNSDLAIDKGNITLLGHSMGGGATLAAALIKPDIGARIALYAPVTVNYLDSYLRYQRNNADGNNSGRAERIRELYGTPEESPEFWAGLNGEPYLDRLNIPVQIYHGTNDQDVPYEWATKIRDQLSQKNKMVEFITYEGEGHEFSFAWERFMQGVEQFTK